MLPYKNQADGGCEPANHVALPRFHACDGGMMIHIW